MHLREEESGRVHIKGVLVACLSPSLSAHQPTARADKVPLVGCLCVRLSGSHWLLGALCGCLQTSPPVSPGVHDGMCTGFVSGEDLAAEMLSTRTADCWRRHYVMGTLRIQGDVN